MIHTGTTTERTTMDTDPALETLDTDLRNMHRRLELLAAHHDPRTVPQGVADGIHDALVGLADARQLLEAVKLGLPA